VTADGSSRVYTDPLTLPVPTGAGVYRYVATNGSNAAAGTIGAPYLTVNYAASQVVAGDVVVIRGGTYRERVTPTVTGTVTNRICFAAMPGERVDICGSDIWTPTWVDEGSNTWSATPDTGLFTDDVWVSGKNPFMILIASTPYEENGLPENNAFNGVSPWASDTTINGNAGITYCIGQVWLNGVWLRQRGTLADCKLAANQWWADQATGKIFIDTGGVAPAPGAVEITMRKTCFRPRGQGRVSFYTLQGITFRRTAGQYPRNFWENRFHSQVGAVDVAAGKEWLITDCSVLEAGSIGIFLGRCNSDPDTVNDGIVSRINIGNNVARRCVVVDAGMCGICTYVSLATKVEDCVIARANRGQFFGHKRYENGGIKLLEGHQGVVSDSWIHDNDCQGVYFDGSDFVNSRITRNVISDNRGVGIHIEFGSDTWDGVDIDHNVIVGNSGSCIYSNDSNGVTVAYNLLANTVQGTDDYAFVNGTGITYRYNAARSGSDQWSFYGNVFAGNLANMDVPRPYNNALGRRADWNAYEKPASRAWLRINKFFKLPADSDAAFQTSMNADLTGNNPGSGTYFFSGRANLTRAEWLTASAVYDATYRDANSQGWTAPTVTWNAGTRTITINTDNGDPATVAGELPADVTADFFGVARTSGACRPGPFAGIVAGSQSFVVWNGRSTPPVGAIP